MQHTINIIRQFISSKFFRIVFLFSYLIIFNISNTMATDSCDNTTSTCTSMCSHVYDDCSMSFVGSSGSAVTEASCVTSCVSTDAVVITCLADVSCTATAIDSCLTYATTTSTTSDDDDSSYVGGGGVSDDEETTTSGGACGEITDCNSCISNCRCKYGGTVAADTCCTGCGCECELYCMPTEWWIATCI